MKDDTDYISGSYEPHAHINACGTGELTVFIDPSEVKTLTLMGDEAKHYDLIEKPTREARCAFCGCTKRECNYLVQSPIGPYICNECVLEAARLMIEKGAENRRADATTTVDETERFSFMECGEWRNAHSYYDPTGVDAELWCEHCDEPLEIDWGFCPFCGRRVAPNCGQKVVNE